MNLGNFGENNLSAVLPKYLRDSLACFTFVNSGVVDGAPDITTCNTNGYMYEIKSKKILRTLNLNDIPSSVSCHYLSENEKLVVFYVVLTKSQRLLIIRLIHKHLKIVTAFDKIKEFQVFDFKCLGFPQIKVTFLNESESLIFGFPVEHQVKPEVTESEDTVVNALIEELEELNRCADELTEEYNHLRKICFSNSSRSAITEKISLKPIDFSSLSNKVAQQRLMVCSKWIKVFEKKLALGLKLHNIGSETLHELEFIINHREAKDYAFSLFQASNDLGSYLFSPVEVNSSVKAGDEIVVVGTFEVPTFFSKSDLSIPCYVTDEKFKNYLVQETFEVNLRDIAAHTIVGLDEKFLVEDLLALKTIKSETRITIQTQDLEDDLMESMFLKNLGFKMIKHIKEKLFYCTSSYLNEVFVALEHIAVNPTIWKMLLFTSEHQQIYFVVNALYDLLPDNTIILCDEDVH